VEPKRLVVTGAAIEADSARYMELFPEEFLSKAPGDSSSGSNSAVAGAQDQQQQQQGGGVDMQSYLQPSIGTSQPQQAAAPGLVYTIGPPDPRPTRPQRLPTLIPPTAALMSAHVGAGGYQGLEPFHTSPPSTDIDMMVGRNQGNLCRLHVCGLLWLTPPACQHAPWSCLICTMLPVCTWSITMAVHYSIWSSDP
jgi:hypothetical protein